jgi:hypothetical protein
VSGAGGSAAWDGEGRPEVEYLDGPRRPEVQGAVGGASVRSEIAGALDEFVDALRTGRTPSGEVHSNVHSLAMVEGAVRSAESGITVALAAVLEDAYRTAVAGERREDVKAMLESWGSAEAGLSGR